MITGTAASDATRRSRSSTTSALPPGRLKSSRIASGASFRAIAIAPYASAA
jgi:hypothetical protein